MENTYGFGVEESIGPYGNQIEAMVLQIKAIASNISTTTNPPYTVSNFLTVFPQFGPEINENYEQILTMFIEMANASINQGRWKSKWNYAMALYVAHFYTLYLQTISGVNHTIGQVVANASAQFPKSSKGVGDVSVSYDVGSILNGLPGWGAWTTTSYGLQLATMAKIQGLGGMFVI